MSYKTSDYSAKDGSRIDFHQWDPSGSIKGIVLIIHGMAEHGFRYDALAQQLNSAGYQVVAPDLRGHGRTAEKSGNFGSFATRDGWRKIVSDILILIKHLRRDHPDTKIYLLGHSMGSYFAQHCAMILSSKLSGMILSASSLEYKASLFPGLVVTWIASRFGFGEKPANWLQRLIFGGYNKVFVPNRTQFDWLASDPKVVDTYIADPLCGFPCTYSFFYDLFWGIWHLSEDSIRSIKPTLPVLMVSGAQDPMGKMGHRVNQLAKIYKSLDFKSVEVKLYARSRHESLNDQEKDEVFRDILNWLATTA